jgi:hypothetical protein
MQRTPVSCCAMAGVPVRLGLATGETSAVTA